MLASTMRGTVSICRLDVDTLAVVDVLEIAPLGREVFDIIEAPGGVLR